ncbi:MAG: hypothetical protein ACRBM6_26330 [Geminicoccales bacterium]
MRSSKNSISETHPDPSSSPPTYPWKKGKRDRQVKLPKDLLGLLWAWWSVRSKRLDVGIPLQERWLFPGGKEQGPLSAR